MEGPGKRVFLSYTSELREFPDDRPFVSAAKDAITRAGCVPVEMSYFTSGEDAPAAH